MYCLFIDSGVEPGVVLLAKNWQLLGSVLLGSKEASFPFAPIEELLLMNHIAMRDIAVLGVGVGPGSYTGIRTSVSVLQALSYVDRMPLIGVPTLFRFIPASDGHYFVGVDARMGGVFSLSASVRQGHVVLPYALQKLPLVEFVKRAQEEAATMIVDQALYERLASCQPCSMVKAVDSFGHILSFMHTKWKHEEYLIGETPPLHYCIPKQLEE